MATTSPVPDVPESMRPEVVANELSEVFQEVIRRDAALVEHFQKAYWERTAIPGLLEARGGVEGLAETLAGLLGMFPDEPGEAETSPPLGERLAGNYNRDAEPFSKHFSAALEKLVTNHPSTLMLFKKHQQEDPRTTREFLSALLRMYARHEVGFPY